MFQAHKNNVRCRLRLTASALVFATASLGYTAANAANVTVASGNTYSLWSGGTTYVVPNGLTAELFDDNGATTTPTTAGDPVLTSGNWMDASSGASTISVASGGTLVFKNPAGWQALIGIVNAAGDVKIDQGAVIFMGTNSFTGNITVGDYSSLAFGQSWSATSTTLGSATNIIMGAGNTIDFYMTGSNTISKISSTSPASLNLYSGSLAVNGINTASNAFYGTVNVNAGATFTVGDSTHATAVLGDLTNKSTIINVLGTKTSFGVLKGYGTIYGSVVSGSSDGGGIVRPGGTSGTVGTLTINGSYKQLAKSQLVVEVSPTGASSLKVNGAATLDGSLIVNVDSGAYGNAIYNVFSATSISGGFSTVSTTGNTAGAIIGLQKTSTSYNIVTEKASASQTFGHVVAANRNALYQFSRSLYDVIAFGAPAGSTAVSGGKVDVWVAPIGQIENVGRNGVGYEEKTYGLSLGAEHRFDWQNAALGGAFSYRAGNMDTKNETSTTSSNGYDMAVYGGADVQNARLDGMVFYNINDASSKRLMTSYGTAATDESGWAWGASIQLSRNLFNDLVTPYLRGTFARVHQDGAIESGTGTFDLAYQAINENTFAADAGLRIHVLRPQEGRKLKLDVDLAVRHDFSDPGEIITGGFATLTGSSFNYNWKGDSANALLVGVNVSDTVMDKLEVFGRLNGSFSQFRRAGEISFGAKYHL